jgi:7-dehydrocholesterol reductase
MNPWVHNYLVPSSLLILCPPTVFIFWYVGTKLDGSFLTFWGLVWEQGFFKVLWNLWSPVFFGSPLAWKMIAIYSAFQLFLMRVIPGKPFLGPITEEGNVPVYKANGVICFIITIATFSIATFGLNLFNASILYDELGYLLGALNCLSLMLCLALYAKGIFYPSSTDSGASGNFLFDYYWGTELYPRILGWDIKQFTNCRFGMMAWPILIISYAAKQSELYGLSNAMVISVALQLVYVGKFFIWETGYFRSLDIMHDRAGFMICWGCLVWLPCIYTSPALYLVHHPIDLSTFLSAVIFISGLMGIMVNYMADRQRQKVRETEGQCKVWGSDPHLIDATYETHQGEVKESILLASGWWGLSRHFHYIPELCAAFFWSMPGLFTNFYPYFYFLFLTVLLVDRAFRHDKRCADKYGSSWDTYCEKVPYKLLPYIF